VSTHGRYPGEDGSAPGEKERETGKRFD